VIKSLQRNHDKSWCACSARLRWALKDVKQGIKIANQIGYPVILKATAGGGGKGMRIVTKDDEFEDAWDSARKEAKASFTNDGIYVEKYVEEPRHIEFQIIGDQYGNVMSSFRKRLFYTTQTPKACRRKSFTIYDA
jgi:acetyl/propionyl-CoA carboxylase alpha subunit